MKIEPVDFFYLAMPESRPRRTAARTRCWCGSTPAACRLGRVRGLAAGLHRRLRLPDVARRLPAGQRLGARRRSFDSPADIARIAARSSEQHGPAAGGPHLSGIEIALWDLLGQSARASRSGGCSATSESYTKTPYASQLFGDTPQETLELARKVRRGRLPRREIRLGAVRPRHVERRRRPVHGGARGPRAGRHPADRRRPDLGRGRRGGGRAAAGAGRGRATWLEEPFHGSAYEAYGALAARSPQREARRRRRRRTTCTWPAT